MTFHRKKVEEIETFVSIRLVFKKAGVDLSKPAIYTCHGGISASVLAFLAQLLGQKDSSVYMVRDRRTRSTDLHRSFSGFVHRMATARSSGDDHQGQWEKSMINLIRILKQKEIKAKIERTVRLKEKTIDQEKDVRFLYKNTFKKKSQCHSFASVSVHIASNSSIRRLTKNE